MYQSGASPSTEDVVRTDRAK